MESNGGLNSLSLIYLPGKQQKSQNATRDMDMINKVSEQRQKKARHILAIKETGGMTNHFINLEQAVLQSSNDVYIVHVI